MAGLPAARCLRVACVHCGRPPWLGAVNRSACDPPPQEDVNGMSELHLRQVLGVLDTEVRPLLHAELLLLLRLLA